MTNRIVLLVLDLLPGVLHVPLPFSDPPLTCCGGLTVCRDRRPRPLSLQNMDADRPVMTTNLDAEDLAQPRALWASCCGVGPASQLDESSSERSKKSPKQATGPPPRAACGRAEMKRAASLRALSRARVVRSNFAPPPRPAAQGSSSSNSSNSSSVRAACAHPLAGSPGAACSRSFVLGPADHLHLLECAAHHA